MVHGNRIRTLDTEMVRSLTEKAQTEVRAKSKNKSIGRLYHKKRRKNNELEKYIFDTRRTEKKKSGV